jgi:hypothetical protein
MAAECQWEELNGSAGPGVPRTGSLDAGLVGCWVRKLDAGEVPTGTYDVNAQEPDELLHLAHLNVGIMLRAVTDGQGTKRSSLPLHPDTMLLLRPSVALRALVQHALN